MNTSNICLLIIDEKLGDYSEFRSTHQATYEFEHSSDLERGLDMIPKIKPNVILMNLESRKYSQPEILNHFCPKPLNWPRNSAQS